jgi:hypothetical protein
MEVHLPELALVELMAVTVAEKSVKFITKKCLYENAAVTCGS